MTGPAQPTCTTHTPSCMHACACAPTPTQRAAGPQDGLRRCRRQAHVPALTPNSTTCVQDSPATPTQNQRRPSWMSPPNRRRVCRRRRTKGASSQAHPSRPATICVRACVNVTLHCKGLQRSRECASACMRVPMYLPDSVRACVRACVCLCVGMCVCVSLSLSLSRSLCLPLSFCVSKSVPMSMSMSVCLRLCVCLCVCVILLVSMCGVCGVVCVRARVVFSTSVPFPQQNPRHVLCSAAWRAALRFFGCDSI